MEALSDDSNHLTSPEQNQPSDKMVEMNPFDMNSNDFNSEIYMNKILKECRLSELMDTEQMLYRQIQTLDSEMQTLIYENYNKFISATET
ncbi:Vacuolar sorting-associated 51-like protein, partial [Sarcoptes scabiei]